MSKGGEGVEGRGKDPLAKDASSKSKKRSRGLAEAFANPGKHCRAVLFKPVRCTTEAQETFPSLFPCSSL